MSCLGARALVCLIALFLVLVPMAAEATLSGAPVAAADGTAPPPGISGHADESSVTVRGRGSAETTSGSNHTVSQNPVEYVLRRMPQSYCGTLESTPSGAPCVEGAPDGLVVRTCADGSTALDPLFRRPVDAAGAFLGPWEQVDIGGCPEDAPADPTVLTVEEFRRLPLAPSTPRLQPADGRGLVNMDLIVFTEPTPQTLTTTVVGVPVSVRATPVEYSWDFGDGSAPLVTTDPGAPYPDYTIGHPYSRPGSYAVQLVTTWAGEYQVAGAGPWLPVDGTATTTSAPLPTEALEAHAHLVAES